MDIFSFAVQLTRIVVALISKHSGIRKVLYATDVVVSNYWLNNKSAYQCKICDARQTLRSGTMLEKSKLSYMIWYKTICLMSATKKGFSAKEIQRQLGLKRYEPVWAMTHKIRDAMGQRDDRYTLEGMIEADEGYFTVDASKLERSKQKRGRGSKTKSNVMIMAESTVLEDIETSKKNNQCRYFKAKVMSDHSAEDIDQTLKNAISKEKSIVFSDKSTSYINIADYVDIHMTEKSSEETTKETLKWVHIAIGNAKRDFQKFHKIKGKYLQLYLNEFIYRLNRRYFGDKIFDRLVIAIITATGR